MRKAARRTSRGKIARRRIAVLAAISVGALLLLGVAQASAFSVVNVTSHFTHPRTGGLPIRVGVTGDAIGPGTVTAYVDTSSCASTQAGEDQQSTSRQILNESFDFPPLYASPTEFSYVTHFRARGTAQRRICAYVVLAGADPAAAPDAFALVKLRSLPVCGHGKRHRIKQHDCVS